jgi:ankyrin repeat protein
MIYKKPVYIKRFQPTLVLLVCLVIISMSASGCRCGNTGQSKSKSDPFHQDSKGSISMKVTPTELKGDQRTTTIKFIPTTSGNPESPTPLEPYQLQVSFPENTRISYTSDKLVDQPLQSGEKVKLDKLLGTEQISTSQVIKVTIVPDTNLLSLDLKIKLLGTEDKEVQECAVRWKQDPSLPVIKIELGYDPVNSKIIYALDNQGEDRLTGIQLRCTNISTDEEGKKVVLNGQSSSTVPIPELLGRSSTDNQFVTIDFKNSPKATVKFEVIDKDDRVLVTRKKLFDKNASQDIESDRALQEVFQETIKVSKDIDMDKIKRLVSRPGFPINQLVDLDSKYKEYNMVMDWDSLFNSSSCTLIGAAIQQDNLELVQWLIKQGAKVDVHTLDAASKMSEKRNNEAIIKALVEASDPNHFPQSFRWAISYENIFMLREILESDQLDVNEQDNSGRIGLHDVAKNDHYLSHSSSVSFNNTTGGYDYKEGYDKKSNKEKVEALLEIMRQMIAKGANVNKQDTSGETPLFLATRSPNISELIKLLLDVPNIQVDLQNERGYTPLHNLVVCYLYITDPVMRNSLAQQISLFIQHGANIDLKSKPWGEQSSQSMAWVPQPSNPFFCSQHEERLFKNQAGKSVLEIAEQSGDNHLVKLLRGEV